MRECKCIKFVQRQAGPPDASHNGRPVYDILNRRAGTVLGQVFWYQSWRQWCARFDEDAAWSHDCLADVRDFLIEMNGGGKS